jgi:DNA-directed RNA polymerase subunit RPC12/RpoP
MNIGEKVAYLKGLAEGIEISSDTKEGKLLTGILDILTDMAESLKDLEEEQENFSVYAEELDEDLGTLERAFIKNNKPREFNFDDVNVSGLNDLDDLNDLNDEFYDEDDFGYENFGDLEGSAKINCPSCDELILFDLDDIEENGSIECPECRSEISVVGEFSSEAACGCGGCGGHGRFPLEDENENDDSSNSNDNEYEELEEI